MTREKVFDKMHKRLSWQPQEAEAQDDPEPEEAPAPPGVLAWVAEDSDGAVRFWAEEPQWDAESLEWCAGKCGVYLPVEFHQKLAPGLSRKQALYGTFPAPPGVLVAAREVAERFTACDHGYLLRCEESKPLASALCALRVAIAGHATEQYVTVAECQRRVEEARRKVWEERTAKIEEARQLAADRLTECATAVAQAREEEQAAPLQATQVPVRVSVDRGMVSRWALRVYHAPIGDLSVAGCVLPLSEECRMAAAQMLVSLLQQLGVPAVLESEAEQ